MIDAEQILSEQVQDLEKQLAGLKAQLTAVRRAKQQMGDPAVRFFEWRPLDAAVKILEENGGKMKKKDLVRRIVEGGLLLEKDRGIVNITVSLERNVDSGNLIEVGDSIELPKD